MEVSRLIQSLSMIQSDLLVMQSFLPKTFVDWELVVTGKQGLSE